MTMTFPCYTKAEAKQRKKARKQREKAYKQMMKVDPQLAFNTFIAPPVPVPAPKRGFRFFR